MYVKSAINYSGSKGRLLDQIIPMFPDNINTFVDLFGGAFNVGINVNAEKVIYNDINERLMEIIKYFKENDVNHILNEVESIIEKFKLRNDNKISYYELVEYYNKHNTPVVLYVLTCYSFNNMIRFNQNMFFNNSFGYRKFNNDSKLKLVKFCKRIQEINVTFSSVHFISFDFYNLGENDFVYCDPPYLNSAAVYNDAHGYCEYGENEERKLIDILDMLDWMGVKFALSCNTSYANPLREELLNRYNAYYLDIDYNNCSGTKKKVNKGVELLITNYECAGVRISRKKENYLDASWWDIEC